MKKITSTAFWIALILSAAQAPALAQGGPEEEPMPPSFQDPPPTAAPTSPPGPEPSATTAPVPAAPSLAPGEADAEAALVLGAPPPATREPAEADGFLPSLAGSIGLFRLSTAEVGPRNHLRVALHGEFFSSSDFLIQGDDNSRLQGGFTFGFTPHRNVEIFGAMLTSSNRNRRNRALEAGARDPELIKSFGDLVLGPKVAMPLSRGVNLGFEAGLKFLSSISDLSFSPSSTSLWLGPLLSLDLRPISNVPLRFHVNANYYVDNSDNLHDFSDVPIETKEVAMFAYGIAASRFRAGLGIDAPLEKLTRAVPLQPFAEYHAEIVTADADPTFREYMSPNCGTGAGRKECRENRDQHWLTFGLRARVWKGVTLQAGADVALRSVGFPYGPPLPPYNVVFGVAYPLDVEAFTRPVVVTRTVERTVPGAAPVEGRVSGLVKSSKDGSPVAGAIVAVNGRMRSRVATDPDGTFQTGGLPPGPAELEVSAPNFEPAKAAAAVSPGTPAELTITLTPKIPTGNVRGRVADDKGRGLEASVKFFGAENFEAKSDSSGAFSAALPTGPYKVTAESPGFPTKEARLEVATAQDKQLEFVLRNRPVNHDVAFTGDGIVLKKPIKFRSARGKLDSKTLTVLDGVADVMDDHPEIKALRIEAHWDTSLGKKAAEVTQQQAQAVKDYLVKKGVSEGRLEALGAGSGKPLVPNLGPANKAKNRRVELHTVK
jgi:outer membrane protein OmpA-like peptidoglycan-associated protein